MLQVNWELVVILLCVSSSFQGAAHLNHVNLKEEGESNGRSMQWQNHIMVQSHRHHWSLYWQEAEYTPTGILQKQTMWPSLPSSVAEVNSPIGWNTASHMAGVGAHIPPTEGNQWEHNLLYLEFWLLWMIFLSAISSDGFRAIPKI